MMVRGKTTVEAKANGFKGEPLASGTERCHRRFSVQGDRSAPHATRRIILMSHIVLTGTSARRRESLWATNKGNTLSNQRRSVCPTKAENEA